MLDVSAEFGTFTCIAGANGIGKSNVFDAIEFLARLASAPFAEAAQQIRGVEGVRGGDARDLFWDGYRSEDKHISLAAEMVVSREISDDLGSSAKATTTFLRYELGLGWEPPTGEGSIGRITLERESLTHITRGDAAKHLHFPMSVKNFRNEIVLGQRRGGAFLSTDSRDGKTIINVHGDGGSFGRPQPRAAERSGRTVLSTVTTNDYPTILAARREMQSWRRLALEPSALRSPNSFTDPRELGSNGQYLASTLYRIAHEPISADYEDPDAVYARVSGRLADLVGVGAEEVSVELDRVREVFTVFLQESGHLKLTARALSEGTLRFLALCVLLEDPHFHGLVCMEEPENGIHPGNLSSIVELVRDLAVDPWTRPDSSNPFRQVIINTHSPGVVQLCDPADLLLAELQPVELPDHSVRRAMMLRPFRDTWRETRNGQEFSEGDVVAYLTAPPDAQLTLPLQFAS